MSKVAVLPSTSSQVAQAFRALGAEGRLPGRVAVSTLSEWSGLGDSTVRKAIAAGVPEMVGVSDDDNRNEKRWRSNATWWTVTDPALLRNGPARKAAAIWADHPPTVRAVWDTLDENGTVRTADLPALCGASKGSIYKVTKLLEALGAAHQPSRGMWATVGEWDPYEQTGAVAKARRAAHVAASERVTKAGWEKVTQALIERVNPEDAERAAEEARRRNRTVEERAAEFNESMAAMLKHTTPKPAAAESRKASVALGDERHGTAGLPATIDSIDDDDLMFDDMPDELLDF